MSSSAEKVKVKGSLFSRELRPYLTAQPRWLEPFVKQRTRKSLKYTISHYLQRERIIKLSLSVTKMSIFFPEIKTGMNG